MAPPPELYLAFAAAFPLVILGTLLLFVRPYRSAQVYFAMFTIAFGLQIATMLGGNLQSDPTLHLRLMWIGHGLMAVATLLLVRFTMIVRRRPYSEIVSLGAFILTAAAGSIIAIRPDLVVESVRGTSYGVLALPFFQAPQRLSLLLAVIVLYREYRLAKAGSARRRFRGMLIAFALLVTYSNTQVVAAILASPSIILQFASRTVEVADPVSTAATLILFFLIGFVLLGLAIHVIIRPPPPEGIDTPLVVAFVFPALVAIGEAFLKNLLDLPVETKGFWQILAVGVLVYTLANYQMFDLELKLKRFVGPVSAGLLALFGIPLLLTLAVGEFGVRAFVIALIPEVVGIAGIIMFQDHIGKALFPGVEENPDYVHQRRLDIYRVALEETIERGGSPDERHLKELRLKHGITAQEHSIISWMVASDHGAAKGQSGGRFEPGQTVLDRYRLMRLIGKGTYGKTFLAYDGPTRHEVALKTVDLETFDGAAARLLLREARLAATLDHPFIIDILDVAELPDRVVVVMEYANTNLDQRLKERDHLEVADAVRFLRELLMALEAVHDHGIVHRNLKPKNLLIEADGSLRLSDFGAAHSDQTGASENTELAGRTLQDLLYQAPEQVRGELATPQSDLFVAGILFHIALTRRHPFPVAGKDDHRLRATLLDAEPELHVHRVAPWSESFLLQALAKDPKARFRTAREMREEFERISGI